MDHSNGEAKHMKVTDLKWHTRDDGETWTLSGDYKGEAGFCINRRMFELQYLGRTKGVSWGERKMRWKAHDRRYWVDSPQDIPEFLDLDEAKAWVDAVVRLDP